MRATLRITWLILSLGFLCHNARSSNSTEVNSPTIAASPTTATITGISPKDVMAKATFIPESSTAVTSSVITSQNSITTHTLKESTVTTVTATNILTTEHTLKGTQTGTATVTNTVTKSAIESMTSNGPTSEVTSYTAVITNSSKNMSPTPMPYSSDNSTQPQTIETASSSVPTERSAAPRSSQNSTHVTTAVTEATHTMQTSRVSTATVTAIPNHGNNKKGSTESSESMTNHNAVITVATTTTGVSSTSLSKRTQSSALKTTELPQQIFTITNTTFATLTTSAQLQEFVYSHKIEVEETDKNLTEVCKKLMVNFENGNCTLKYYKYRNGTIQINSVETNGKVNSSIAQQYYEEITTKPKDNKTFIAILASCVALLIMIVILGACASHHRKPYNENQQHLTEELHTVENGYHDNPTLEVMEVQPEMQEKKVVLNGEFNDSWIVPFDNLLKEEIPDEEDTHL